MAQQKKKKNQDGFWTAFVILFLLTLTLLAFGAWQLMRGESSNITNQVQASQADYSANAGAYFGIRALQNGALDETQSLQVGGGTVTLDTSLITGSTDILLVVQADVENANRAIEIEISNPGRLRDKAVYTTGNVFNVAGRDSLGNTDPSRVVTLADSVPSIDETTLEAMSLAQGHTQSASNFKPSNNYPSTSFYQPDGVTPNVTHVQNDMTVQGGRDIYGIFVVDGNVTAHGSSRIYGIVYLPNPTSTVITGGGNPSQSTINGGIVSHGNISGTGNHISVKHWPEYMDVFCSFLLYPGNLVFQVVDWRYI